MAERSQSPTVRRRRLAAELRRLREAAGMTMEEAAHALDLSQATISRLEAAKTARPRPRDIRDIIALYGVTDERHREEVMDLVRGARERGWWEQYKGVFIGSYVGLEAEASSIRTFEPLIVPGLLQTPEYTTALTRSQLVRDPAEVEQHVAARMRRQEILAQDRPPRFWAIIDEAALLRPVGDAGARRRQLQRLIDTHSLEHVTIQIMPMSAGAHIGLGGQFVILDFPLEADRSVVYVETPACNLYLEECQHITRYDLIFQHLCAEALGVDASIAYLSDLISRL
ncbi:transcriptional regulator [Spongiactinospora rosea]|uniref:Transcriptional regulator n=1 Tax=Spongiactinospora rosea TaxID=2248750 RepID=A0A366M6K6_9ACTN|nr:helix-turn-helix transcriptional regulator [Spongiactinospora rosea]RBQ21443.1 transcriptional regulator [Spongiactinospora rosea]